MSRSTFFLTEKNCFITHAQGTILYECGIKLGLIVLLLSLGSYVNPKRDVAISWKQEGIVAEVN